MKKERQTRIFISTMIIIFVLITFLIPLRNNTNTLFNNSISIPISMSIDGELKGLSKEIYNIANQKYIVIYKDGLNGSIFQEEIYYDCEIDNIPKFKGDPTNSNYKFIGWFIEMKKDIIFYTANYEKSS
jgi:predicted small secreted protein